MTNNSKERKETPIVTGVLDYFPDAIAGVARVSFKGNQKHNPGQSLQWSRHKSTDHADCIGRHLAERDLINDESGEPHYLHIAWRALAYAQLAEEKRLGISYQTYTGADINKDGTLKTCPVCDGGPGNNCACTCPKQETWQLLSPEVVKGRDTEGWAIPKRVYIAGPMRGIKGFNFPAFDAARDRLKARGYEVFSPADIDREKGQTDNRGYAKRDTEVILTCDKLYLLKGWTKSVGAAGEFFLARWIGLEIECENGSTDPLFDYCSDNMISRPTVRATV